MKNILVTGASGFIGSFIVEEALKKGMSVWAGVRPTSSKAYLKQEELHFISFDFDDSDKLREQLLLFKQQEGGFDYIVHCAGVTKCVHQSDFDRVNYWQTKRFVDLLCEMAINLADEEFQTMTWKEFAKTVSADKAELKEYLKIRGLEE